MTSKRRSGYTDRRLRCNGRSSTSVVYDVPPWYAIFLCDKGKILVNSIKPTPFTNIWMNGKTLEEVDQFKYTWSTQTKDGMSIKKAKIRLAQAHSAMTRLAILWKHNAICFHTKNFYTSHVLSILLYECESWTLMADLEWRIQAFKNKCYERMLGISYRKHKPSK